MLKGSRVRSVRILDPSYAQRAVAVNRADLLWVVVPTLAVAVADDAMNVDTVSSAAAVAAEEWTQLAKDSQRMLKACDGTEVARRLLEHMKREKRSSAAHSASYSRTHLPLLRVGSYWMSKRMGLTVLARATDGRTSIDVRNGVDDPSLPSIVSAERNEDTAAAAGSS